MPINIKNGEAEKLLNSLSRRLRTGKTQLVLTLLRQEATRQARVSGTAEKKLRIKALARRFSLRARRVELSPDEIIGYGEDGLPK